MSMGQTADELSFLYGTNSSYIEELYARFLHDPGTVDESWRDFFAELDDDERAVLDELEPSREAPQVYDIDGRRPGPAAARPSRRRAARAATAPPRRYDAGLGAGPVSADEAVSHYAVARDSIRILMMIRAYRVRGHLAAKLDPLGSGRRAPPSRARPQVLRLHRGGPGPRILRRRRAGHPDRNPAGDPRRGAPHLLRQSIGVEFMHIQSPEEKAWIQRKLESTSSKPELEPRRKEARALEELYRSEGFEKFLSIKYPGSKRFSLEGAESTIPAMETVIRTAAQPGRRGDRAGHAPPRPPQRADQRDGQVLHGRLLGVPGRGPAARLGPGLGRREVPPGHLGRPRGRRCGAGSTCR